MNWMSLDNSTGTVHGFIGKAEVVSVKKETLNIDTCEDLIAFIKSVGGIVFAIDECKKINNL